MNEPAIDLPEQDREQLVTLLNDRLADAIDLMLMAKLAHWNVAGPASYTLHGPFDRVYRDLAEHVDILAERTVQLGGEARGDLRRVARASRLEPYPVGTAEGEEHIRALSTALSSSGQIVRRSVEQAQERGDRDTADILNGVSRDLEKHLWILRTLVEGAEGAA